MGATFSCSSPPPTETLLLKIEEYSKLMRVPGRDHFRAIIRLHHLWWVITVRSADFNKETGFSEFLQVYIFLGPSCIRESDLGIDISVEILDKTCIETVFQRESRRGTRCTVPDTLLLTVRRRELEASSCVRRRDDCFYFRCTVREQPGLLARWFPPSEVYVPMAICKTFTVHSLSEMKAALRSGECVHSTRFAVGGSRWYLKLDPTLARVCLVRATKQEIDGETPRTTAEFTFKLEGAVNVQSEKMTHTFDRDSPDCAFEYHHQQQQPAGNQQGPVVTNGLLYERDILFSKHVPEDDDPTTTSTDGLIVRCCVQVIPDLVAPTTSAVVSPAAATVVRRPAPAVSPTDSERTSLLSAMHG